MFTPLTISIFRGALSPLCMEEEHLIADRLLWATRQLEDLSGSPETLTHRFSEVLSAWHVHLPRPAFDFLSSESCFLDANATAALCGLRVEEMEYAMSISYCEAPHSLLHSFYQAILRAEAHWLKLLLQEQIRQLRSDFQARLLLCEVLDEVYATGVLVDDACRGEFAPPVCRLLKGALASLYLELSVDFGYLLQPADYMNYRSLMSDVRYQCPIQERKALEYDILQAENRVKRLVSTDTTAGKEAAASKLYDELIRLLVALEQATPTHQRLWQGLMALENYIFFTTGHHSLTGNNLYSILTDPVWIKSSLNDFYNGAYLQHMDCNEGRRAAQWVFKKMNEPCISFLQPLATFDDSIPRKLLLYLQHQQDIYEEHYPHVFTPMQPDQQLTMVSLASGNKMSDVAEIHILLAFLHEVPDDNGICLMTPEHAQWFEEEFISFLQSGKLDVTHRNMVKVQGGHIGEVYGLIFHYHQQRGGDKLAFARFLASVLAVDIQPDVLKSNYGRCIREYKAFAKKMKLRSFSLHSLTNL